MTSEIRANIIKNRVGLGTIEYSNTGPVISGVTTASNFKTGTSNLHSTGLNIQDLDVDGHTNLDNVSIAGVSTFSGNIKITDRIKHIGDEDTLIRFPAADTISFETDGSERLRIQSTGIVKVETSDSSSFNAHLVVNNSESNSGVSLIGSGSSFSAGGWAAVTDAGIIRSSANSSNGLVLQAASGDMRFYVGGNPPAERLRIKSDGDVLIGTQTTAGKLTVDSGGNTTAGYISVTSGGGGRLRLGYAFTGGPSNDQFAEILTDTDGDLDIATRGNNSSQIKLFTSTGSGSEERLRIDSNGRILIGHNTTPTASLSVAVVGSYGASSTSTPFVYLCRDEAATAISGGESLGQILFASNDGYRGAIIEGVADGAWSGSSSDASLVFKTTPDNSTVPVERLRITSDGNFGIGTDSPVARLHIHNSGTSAADHAYAFFTTGDTGSTASDGLTIGVAANQVASVNYREAGTLVLNTSATPRITILSNGHVGINDSSPASNTQLSVKTDGLDDNTYGFSTEYRSGSNASGYTASGIVITSQANNSNGEDHTAFIRFSNRTAAQNGAHGVAGFITLSTPDAQGTYGTGEYNFYCRNGAPYSFPNDPAVASNFWMSSLFKIKSTGEIFGYGDLRIDKGTAADGIIGAAYGTTYFGMKQADQGASEYMMITNNTNTYISCTSGYSVYIRPSANSQTHETVFAHDNTTFKSNIVLDNHQLRRNQHHKGHMEGGYNNIGSSTEKTSPIYTIGSSYNPNENDLDNMYGIGYSHTAASFINSNAVGSWGMYVASDGDARIFLGASDGRIFADQSYGRTSWHKGHLEGGHTNIGASQSKTNPIFTIGSSYNPNESDLSNMYGVGYANGDSASYLPAGGWGLYVAADGDARVFLDATNGYLKFNGGSGAVHFTNGSWSGEHSDGKIQTHGTNMYFQNAGGSWQFRKTNGTAAANIASNGTYTASDLTFKKDVATISNSVDTIKKLTGRSFTWKEDNTKSFGVIAQEVETVLPELVSLTEEPEGSKVEPSKMVNYPAFAGHFIEAIKELSAKIETLESKVAALEG